jgi:hypothetical protein
MVAAVHRTAMAIEVNRLYQSRILGGVVEWLMVPVLKFEFKILD